MIVWVFLCLENKPPKPPGIGNRLIKKSRDLFTIRDFLYLAKILIGKQIDKKCILQGYFP